MSRFLLDPAPEFPARDMYRDPALEAHVDRVGFGATVRALAEIAAAKADKLAETWRDPAAMHRWQRASRALWRASRDPSVVDMPASGTPTLPPAWWAKR
jgi:hypothetical protein